MKMLIKKTLIKGLVRSQTLCTKMNMFTGLKELEILVHDLLCAFLGCLVDMSTTKKCASRQISEAEHPILLFK